MQNNRLISRRNLLLSALALPFVSTVFPVKMIYGQAIIHEIRAGIKDASVERLVIELSLKVNYSYFVIPNPPRLIIDIQQSQFSKAPQFLSTHHKLIKNVRFGNFDDATFRIVIDLSQPIHMNNAFYLSPSKDNLNWRLVLDIEATSEKKFIEQVQKTEKPPEPIVPEIPIKVKKPIKNANRKIIVLDAGHGGVDPGALGRIRKTKEKEITFSASLEFKKIIESDKRYKVYLVRQNDVFIKLRNRVQIARNYQADLFISLHADSHTNSSTRGLSVYTLSEKSSDKEAAALAEKENKSDIIAGLDLKEENAEVSNILIDLARRETLNYSSLFAELLIEKLQQKVSLLRRSHRFAGFAVLKSPDTPSVLVEMGYLSNRQEEALLMQSAYRKKLGLSVKEALDKYFYS